MSRYAIALLALTTFTGILYLNSQMQGEETHASERTKLAEQLLLRFGKPDATKDWNGTAFDYKLDDGRIFTVSITEDERVWAGVKTDLKANIGKEVALSGIYMGPGKAANYIYTNDAQSVYINLLEKGGVFPEKMQFGDRISLTGILRFSPGFDSGSPFRTGRPSCFYVDNPTVMLNAK